MKISKRVKNIQTSGIREIFEASKKKKAFFDFSLGQPDFAMPIEGKRAAIAAIAAGKTKYTENQGILPLRQEIAKKITRENRIHANAEDIIVTAGVTGGLALAFLTLLDPGDEVIVCDPYFPLYVELPRLFGAKVRLLDTYPDFAPRPDKLEALISRKTKVLLINTPHAPTGRVYSQTLLRKISRIAKKHNLTIISDEIYEDFIYDGAKHFSIGSIYKNTVTLNGLSKSGGMPGLRIGYLHAPAQIIPEMIKVQQFLYCCAPTPAQYAAVQILLNHSRHANQIKKSYQQKKDLVARALRGKFDFLEPQGGFYCFIKAPRGNGQSFAKKGLTVGVVLVPGKVFSRRNTHFRLAFCVDNRTIINGVKKILTLTM